MDIQLLLNKAINFEFLSVDEGVFLYKKAPLNELMYIANKIRFKHNPEPKVSWIIDRNINISNICFVKCKFCNFCRSPNHQEAYITSTEEYITKINELKKWGGNQILLQGGLNPSNDLNFYVQLFKTLKKLFPEIKLHALSPPEIIHICKISKKNIEFVLEKLILAGLDSLPGGGAEILSDRVRKIISPAKCSSKEWLKVMQVAHKLNITTTATMMFGHIETIEERIMHLIKIRDIQSLKPPQAKGFISFTCWPFQNKNTRLEKELGPFKAISKEEYLRTMAIARIILCNIPNIQASWLTMGYETAQLCLHAGANDLGSVMMEENVVSSAGISKVKLYPEEMEKIIITAGFTPIKRNQQYEFE